MISEDEWQEACGRVGIEAPTPLERDMVEEILYDVLRRAGAQGGKSTALALARELESMGHPRRRR